MVPFQDANRVLEWRNHHSTREGLPDEKVHSGPKGTYSAETTAPAEAGPYTERQGSQVWLQQLRLEMQLGGSATALGLFLYIIKKATSS